MKNIVLIGMSGVGKSEKGRYLADILGWNFIDTDQEIVNREKITIENIFIRHGEEYFRDIESKLIEEVSRLSNTVISTGGGIVIRSKNIEFLRKNGYIFLFMGKIQTIVNNLSKSDVVRPLLKGDSDLYQKVETLFNKREDLYRSSCDTIIYIDDKTKEQVCKEVLNEYERLDQNK
jgi:shikimate kinase